MKNQLSVSVAPRPLWDYKNALQSVVYMQRIILYFKFFDKCDITKK